MDEYTEGERKLVFPGDELAISEEYMGLDGTYEDSRGIVRAAVIGLAVFNSEERTVSVQPLPETPRRISVGDTVVGWIKDVRNNNASVEVLAVSGETRPPVGPTEGQISIAGLPQSSVRYGDYVRARVMQVGKKLSLSIESGDCGVIKAFCSACRTPLERLSATELQCPSCERKWKRKLVPDYGEGNI